MPEILEVEQYRQQASAVIGRRVSGVELLDPAYWRSDDPPDALIGTCVSATRRTGKLLLLDSDDTVLGIRFGMTGRLLVDGSASIDTLEYSSARDLPEWHRFALAFDDGGSLVVTDPRRLGWVEMDPDETRLGVDAFEVDAESLATILAASGAALKSRLMDQARIAGLGNLLTDEILFRAGLDPTRPARTVSTHDVEVLDETLHEVLGDLGRRGGSHTGDLQPFRTPGSRCPRDDTPLRRSTVGGRTTWWCPDHQR
ncbi:MAG: DNA-formamidopyrimidine glycosylase family protein [Acidimicrobiales bacterium]